MTSPKNLINFTSPNGAPEKNILESHSPSCSNPFDDALKTDKKISINSELSSSPFYSCNTSFKEDLDRPFVAPLDLNSCDSDNMLARESLGILPTTTLFRDSLTSCLLNISFKDVFNTSSSPRESLGVLNLSAMDLGRESIGLFNIQNSFLRRKSIGDDIKNNFNRDDFNFDNIDTAFEKSPLQIENPVPALILSTSTTQEKMNSFSLSGLNNAFIFPHSRLSSAVSGGSSYNLSCNPYFNSRSLEEPSKISPGFSQKDSEMSQSGLAITDSLNDAFRISTNNNNKHSVSQIVTSSTTGTKGSSGVEVVRSRINSLPVSWNDHIFADVDLETNILNGSYRSGPLICRGVERDKELDDSVFIEAKRVASIIEDSSFISDEKLNNSNELLLDATPQPEWPEDLDSSEEKAKSPKCDKETILKQVDKMLGMQPVNLEEKLKLKSSSKSVSPSMDNNIISQNISKISGTSSDNNGENRSDNYSQNISKISRTSQKDNCSQNLSKISQIREEKVIKLVHDVSDLINDNDNLSQSQMEQLRALVHRLSNMFNDSRRSKSFSADDSGHSSVGDRHLEENKCVQYDGKNEVKTADNSEEICQALDLSCRGKSSGEIARRPSMLRSPALVDSSACLIKKPKHKDVTNASGASMESNTSDANSKINYSDASARSCNISTASRYSNISQSKVALAAAKPKKSIIGVATAAKKGPLRAVLPIENMAKGKNVTKVAVTPERKDNELPFGLCSKKTSTPIQEPKLKPMAASTPANRNPKDSKDPNTPLARPKYSRSFSYQHRASSTAETSENPKTRQSMSGITKTVGNKSQVKANDTKLARRNSVTEGTLRQDSESPMRIKRSFSTGKEPKILSALSRVRQNILNSPYYNPRKSAGAAAGQSPGLSENVMRTETDLKGCSQELKRLSMISHPNKPGKENLQP